MPVYRVITVTRRASRSGADFRDISKLTISGASKVEKIKNEWKFSFQGGETIVFLHSSLKLSEMIQSFAQKCKEKFQKFVIFPFNRGEGGGSR